VRSLARIIIERYDCCIRIFTDKGYAIGPGIYFHLLLIYTGFDLDHDSFVRENLADVDSFL
jgi:hypothetical protein